VLCLIMPCVPTIQIFEPNTAHYSISYICLCDGCHTADGLSPVCGEHAGRHSVDSCSDQTQQQYTVDSRHRASPSYLPILGLTCCSDLHSSSLQLEVKCWLQSEGKHLQSDIWSLHSCCQAFMVLCGWMSGRSCQLHLQVEFIMWQLLLRLSVIIQLT
jgi:hypothetical protein